MKKTVSILLILLAVSSFSLFAQGAIEKGENEKLIQVVSIEKTEDGYYEVYGIVDDGSDIIYYLADDLKINFPVEEIKPGMYVYVEDKGMMTMSIPPQSPAIGVRNVTMAVKGGLLAYPSLDDFSLDISEPNLDDIYSAFSYSLGYLTTANYVNSGIVFNAGYFAKGVLDAWQYLEVESFFTLDEMNDYLNQYVNEVLSSGVLGEIGSIYTSLDDINALPKPEALDQKFAYSYGYLITLDLLFQGYDLVAPDFATGALYALYGLEPLADEETLSAKIDEYSAYLTEKYMAIIEEMKVANLEEANAFLEANKTADGVETLDSGVQIALLEQDGEPGAVPTETDSVVVSYILTLLDGTRVDEGNGVTFNLQSMIPGFREAVTHMHVGDSIIAYIPPELGYGESGAGDIIEPNSLLIFQIMLHSIVQTN